MLLKKLIRVLIGVLIGVVIVIPIAFCFIPIKFTKNKLIDVNADEFYIIEFTPESNTEGNICYIIGDETGIWSKANSIVVSLIGEDPRNDISSSICNNGTTFVIYGTLTEEVDEYWGYRYTLCSNSWDFFQEIKGGIQKKYITIYDLKYVSSMFE